MQLQCTFHQRRLRNPCQNKEATKYGFTFETHLLCFHGKNKQAFSDFGENRFPQMKQESCNIALSKLWRIKLTQFFNGARSQFYFQFLQNPSTNLI
jgi:hypothetical protein